MVARGNSTGNPELISVEVAYAEPQVQSLVALTVAEGTSARQAVERSGLLSRFPQIDIEDAGLGVFGRRLDPETILRDGDRVEVYRHLQVGPREARRRRAKRKRRRDSCGGTSV